MHRFMLFLPLLVATSAYAGARAEMSFEQLDTNKDGQLSAEEASYNLPLSKMWNKVDQDGSGAVDKAEFSAFEVMQVPATDKTE